jgi:plastocyanin
MNKAFRIAVLPLILIVCLGVAGCELLSPTYVPYESASTTTGKAAAKKATPAPKDEAVPLSTEPVLGTPVDIVRGVLRPGRVYIKIGATVTWVNHDKVGRNITGGTWGGATIPPGGRYSLQFNRAGTYAYTSLWNPNMAGEVIVE